MEGKDLYGLKKEKRGFFGLTLLEPGFKFYIEISM